VQARQTRPRTNLLFIFRIARLPEAKSLPFIFAKCRHIPLAALQQSYSNLMATYSDGYREMAQSGHADTLNQCVRFRG
jgi:hypothetical protein